MVIRTVWGASSGYVTMQPSDAAQIGNSQVWKPRCSAGGMLMLMHSSDLVSSWVSQGEGSILWISCQLLTEGWGMKGKLWTSNYELGVAWLRMLLMECRTTEGEFTMSKHLRTPQGLRIPIKVMRVSPDLDGTQQQKITSALSAFHTKTQNPSVESEKSSHFQAFHITSCDLAFSPTLKWLFASFWQWGKPAKTFPSPPPAPYELPMNCPDVPGRIWALNWYSAQMSPLRFSPDVSRQLEEYCGNGT